MKNILVKMFNKMLGPFKPISTYEFDFKNHVYKEYYENGQLKREKPTVNGKKHGTLKEYYKTGELRSEILYVDGEKHGICKGYYETVN